MKIPTRARAMASSAVRAERAAHLRDAHVAPINNLIDEIARAFNEPNLPYIDPLFGGVNAQALLVMKAPEADANPDLTGTRFLCLDNDDTGAATIFTTLAEVGVDRSLLTAWNICPFPIVGQNPNADELRRAAPYTKRMLAMLPALRVVVLLGGAARNGWDNTLLGGRRGVTVVAGASPSPPGINNPRNRSNFEAAMSKMAKLL